MVPFQTILALLLVLLAVSSCSQMDPPHPDAAAKAAAQAQSQFVNSNFSSGNTSNATWVDTSVSGVAQFNLLGADAQTLFSVMSIATEQAGGISNIQLKQGSQFNCVNSSVGYSCGFTIELGDGSIPVILQKNDVKPQANFLSPLAALSSEYDIKASSISELPMPQFSSKVRVCIYTAQASIIYEGLKLPEVMTSGNGEYSEIGVKKSDYITCTKQISKANPNSALYFCDLYLDVSSGSVDKPSEDGSLYTN